MPRLSSIALAVTVAMLAISQTITALAAITAISLS